jgi:hypothetical protein
MTEKKCLVPYWNMKQEWRREMYIDQRNLNERNGLAWFTLGIWKPRGKRRGAEKGTCPLWNEEEKVVPILLKCNETPRWREQFIHNKWQYINKEVA